MIKTLYSCFQHWSEKGSVWILSDTHFEDSDCRLMDPNWITPEAQIDIINKYVYPNDTFVHLGDVGNPKWMTLIKSKYRVLLLGNHDFTASKFKPYFNEIYTGPLFIADKILLSHEPINGLPFCYNIHGHDHSNWNGTDDKHLNLAANCCEYTPVNLGKLIKQGVLSKIDNIHRITIDKASKKGE